MEIIKVLNNSTLIAKDKHLEIVIMGKGIAFGKKTGEEVDESKIEKIFYLGDTIRSKKLAELLSQIPVHHFELARNIIDTALEELKVPLHESIYLTFTEHIHFAITRQVQHLHVPNALLSEIKMLYDKEFKIAEKAIQYIYRETGILLSEDEAGFIAFHLVNAKQQKQCNNKKIVQMLTIVQRIMQMIEEFYHIKLVESDLVTIRLMTHLKFLVLRLVTRKKEEHMAEDLMKLLQKHCDKALLVMPLITNYLKTCLNIEIFESELVYLTIHIQRLLMSN